MKAHSFFAGVDWDNLTLQKVGININMTKVRQIVYANACHVHCMLDQGEIFLLSLHRQNSISRQMI